MKIVGIFCLIVAGVLLLQSCGPSRDLSHPGQAFGWVEGDYLVVARPVGQAYSLSRMPLRVDRKGLLPTMQWFGDQMYCVSQSRPRDLLVSGDPAKFSLVLTLKKGFSWGDSDSAGSHLYFYGDALVGNNTEYLTCVFDPTTKKATYYPGIVFLASDLPDGLVSRLGSAVQQIQGIVTGNKDYSLVSCGPNTLAAFRPGGLKIVANGNTLAWNAPLFESIVFANYVPDNWILLSTMLPFTLGSKTYLIDLLSGKSLKLVDDTIPGRSPIISSQNLDWFQKRFCEVDN